MAPFEQSSWNLNATEIWYSQAALDSYALGGLQSSVDRSKTPTGSLIARTSRSPAGSGPISLARSRNLSQTSDEMDWNDAPGSLSGSPTSIRTPDNDSFEQDLQNESEEVRNFYQFGDMASHMRPEETDAMDIADIPTQTTELYNFPTQDLQSAFVVTIPRPFNTQNVPSLNTLPHMTSRPMTSQPYNNYYASTFTRQPHQQDPWNAQRPLRNQNAPGAADLVFDPESDVDFSAFVNNDWTDSTNPNFIMSPNSSNVSPMDNQFYFPNPMDHGMQMNINASSANQIFPPSSTVYTENYLQEPQTHSSPGATSSGAQSGLSSGLSPYQDHVSPVHSAQSPGSDGVFSYQHSDPGTMMDSFTIKKVDDAPPTTRRQSSNTSKSDNSQDEMVYGPVEPPEPPEPQERPRQRNRAALHGRPGGRQLGSHLKPEVAKDAHDMRKVVACWHCVLQRDKCGPGDTCERCLKRAQRPNTDCGLGCSRVKLIELTCCFLPTIVTSIHEDSSLTNFVARHIQRWSNIEVSLRLTCGKGLPQMSCKVYEFLPSTSELLRQFQYKTDPKTQKRIRQEKRSPPLGMIQINHNDEKKYDKYINDIVENYLDAFADGFWAEDTNDFEFKLFKLMTKLQSKSDDEAKLLKEVFRLIVVTYIMGRTITIAEDTKEATLSKLHSYAGPGSYVENYCSPRMTNRQLKYFFCRLHRTIMQNVLNKLQQIFKSSKGCDKWTAAFCALLGLAIAHEDNQKTIHLVMETRAASGETSPQNAQLESDYACREIDNKFTFISAIFRWKYNRSCNPLRDSDHDWSSKLKDPHALVFVRQVASLVKENIDFLSDRQRVSISSANQTKYGSRLVAQFLLSFWLPS